jgi:hypothetical protein
VAFRADLVSGEQGIFTGSGGPTTTIADTSGVFDSFSDGPSINAGGTVAFQAFLDTGEEGIFTGPNAVADKVIQIGDALDGSTVTNLLFFREAFNAHGQLTFFATLANGQEGIFRADPVPEPGPVVLMGGGLACWLAYRWWRRRT